MLLRNARNISSSKAIGTLSWHHPLQAKVGERVRIFFGVGGPNCTSSFHVIGEIFDKVYALGGLETAPLEGIQTVTVPPGRGRHHRIQNTGVGQVVAPRDGVTHATARSRDHHAERSSVPGKCFWPPIVRLEAPIVPSIAGTAMPLAAAPYRASGLVHWHFSDMARCPT
jgi:hypothetical protein